MMILGMLLLITCYREANEVANCLARATFSTRSSYKRELGVVGPAMAGGWRQCVMASTRRSTI